MTAGRRVGLLGWAGLLVWALGAAPSGAAALTVTDPTGREITLPAPPRRIVSLVPSVTEILFAIQAEDRLVGVTDFCDWPPAARRKPRVGGMLAPSLEVIVRSSPTWPSSPRRATARRPSSSSSACASPCTW